MAADKEVLREFLMSLGFSVDEQGARKFANSFLQTTKLAGTTSAAILGVAAASEIMVQRFAGAMERLYYASKRTLTTVDNLQAIEFAAGQVGLTGKEVTGALEQMAWALKRNPGLSGLLSKLGINPQSTNLLNDFVKRMSQLPLLIRSQYAEMFGLDPRMLQQLIQFMPEFLAAEEKRLRMQRESGVDADKAAAAGRDYMNTLRGLWEQVGILGQKLSIELLPYFKQFAEYASDGLQWLIKWKNTDLDLSEWHEEIQLIVTDIKQLADMLKWAGVDAESTNGFFWLLKNGAKDFAHGLLEVIGALSAFISGNWSAIPGHLSRAFGHFTSSEDSWKSDEEKKVDSMYGGGGKPAAKGMTRDDLVAAVGGSGSTFHRLETVYGLPEGLLDKVWNAESGRGKNMLSPAGAQGHFGFMPDTAKEMGVSDPNNFMQSATGAAKYLHQLMGHYGGNLQYALAAYNWGMGNVDNKGIGAAPLETRKYVQGISGSPITINTKIEVSGASDPETTAKAIGAEQSRLYGDIIRTFPKVIH